MTGRIVRLVAAVCCAGLAIGLYLWPRIFWPTRAVAVHADGASGFARFRSPRGEILLDSGPGVRSELYLIDAIQHRIVIPNRSSILFAAHLAISKESEILGASLAKAEIRSLPVWKDKSVDFVGVNGRILSVKW